MVATASTWSAGEAAADTVVMALVGSARWEVHVSATAMAARPARRRTLHCVGWVGRKNYDCNGLVS